MIGRSAGHQRLRGSPGVAHAMGTARVSGLAGSGPAAPATLDGGLVPALLASLGLPRRR